MLSIHLVFLFLMHSIDVLDTILLLLRTKVFSPTSNSTKRSRTLWIKCEVGILFFAKICMPKPTEIQRPSISRVTDEIQFIIPNRFVSFHQQNRSFYAYNKRHYLMIRMFLRPFLSNNETAIRKFCSDTTSPIFRTDNTPEENYFREDLLQERRLDS